MARYGKRVMMQRAVFLDLNGTLVLPVAPDRLGDLALIDCADEAVALLSQAGFVCPVVTVQSRIAKGVFSAAEFSEWFSGFARRLRARGAVVVGPYVCPHRFAEPCDCKKPQTLLYERAAREHGIALSRSFAIGDSPDDVRAALNFGGRGCLVRTGWAADPRVEESAAPYAAVVTDSLEDAARWILRDTGEEWKRSAR